MNALLIGALARVRLAAQPVRKSAWSDDHRNPHTYAPHDAMTREGVRALATEGFLLQLSNWREEKTDAGLFLLADMGLWHGLSGTWWPMTPWREPLEGGADRGKAWHAAQVAARAYAHREVCSLEVLDESRAADLSLPPKDAKPPAPVVDGLSQEDRDAFARSVGAPTEEEERELRKSETEAKLRADLAPPAPAPKNGTTPHLDPEPTLPPHPASQLRGDLLPPPPPAEKAGKLLALPLPCPVCRGEVAGPRSVCPGCTRLACRPCLTPAGPCTDCAAADSTGEWPHLDSAKCEKARELLATLGPLDVLEHVGVDTLGDGPDGWLLGLGAARWRVDDPDELEAWLRGDVTVGIDEDEDQDEAAPDTGSGHTRAESTAPSTSPGAGSPTGEMGASSVAPAEPTPEGTSPAGDPPNPSPATSTAGGERPGADVGPSEETGGGAPTHCTVHVHGPDMEASLRGKAVTLIRPGEPGEPKGGNWKDGGPWCHPCTEARRAGAPLYTTPFALDDTTPLGRYAVRLRGGSVAWAAAATLREAGELRRAACDRGYGPSGVWVEDREDPVADDGGGRDLTAEAEVACLAKPSDEVPLLQPSPGLLSAVDVILANGEASRKALGEEWEAFPSHMAQKKPGGPCALCPHEIAKGQAYHAGRGKWTKKKAHAICIRKLLEGKDPKVNERHQIEREAIDRLTPAAAGGEA